MSRYFGHLAAALVMSALAVALVVSVDLTVADEPAATADETAALRQRVADLEGRIAALEEEGALRPAGGAALERVAVIADHAMQNLVEMMRRLKGADAEP